MMYKNIRRIFSLLIITILFSGCSKEEDPPFSVATGLNSTGGNNPATTTCSTISAQTTVTNNGVSYKINALSGSNNSIGIEVMNLTGAFASSYSMQLLQVTNGSSCYESSSSSEALSGSLGKFFEFQNMPAWSINTSTVAKVKIKLNGTTYYIQDSHLDQN